ncbi:MAG TPA: ATP-binding protein [Nocardioides sp.]|nr:ATP-binding protein [Nocardioides sp.]
MTSRVRLARAALVMLRNAARRAPIDPTLEIVYTRAGSDAPIIDATEPQRSGDRRVRTLLERGGKPIAALVHDPALLRDPDRLRAAVEAAWLAIDNERLKAQLQDRLQDVEASRARIVAAADRERRRVERNLHDGAQQRLVGLALMLRLVTRERLDPTVTGLLKDALAELDTAIEELRGLARGVHPAIVTDVGLGGALESLAERPGLPVDLLVDIPVRLPDRVEVAAYYLVAEALANTNKHAHAAQVSVRAALTDGALRVAVSDDGRGGAAATAGSGLEGLADRISALGGQLVVDSPPGRGTTVSAELPLQPQRPNRRPQRSLAAMTWMGWENWEVPAELYPQVTEMDNLNQAKASMLCAGGNGALTEREREWHLGYRAACGDSDRVLEAVRSYDDSDRIEDIVGLPSMRVAVRAAVHDALRICASDGPLTADEVERVHEGARRMGVPPDVVEGVRRIVLDEIALRSRRYDLISRPMFLTEQPDAEPTAGSG